MSEHRDTRFIRLTRAQCLAFWALATVLPVDTEIEIQTRESAGHLLVRAFSPGWNDDRHYRLNVHGGHEMLDEERGELGALDAPLEQTRPTANPS